MARPGCARLVAGEAADCGPGLPCTPCRKPWSPQRCCAARGCCCAHPTRRWPTQWPTSTGATAITSRRGIRPRRRPFTNRRRSVIGSPRPSRPSTRARPFATGYRWPVNRSGSSRACTCRPSCAAPSTTACSAIRSMRTSRAAAWWPRPCAKWLPRCSANAWTCIGCRPTTGRRTCAAAPCWSGWAFARKAWPGSTSSSTAPGAITWPSRSPSRSWAVAPCSRGW